jgi:hypothetical protein
MPVDNNWCRLHGEGRRVHAAVETLNPQLRGGTIVVVLKQMKLKTVGEADKGWKRGA